MSKMTNIKVLGLALFAVFAFSMVAAASAFAVSEWLWEALPIPAGVELLTNTEGELTIVVLNLAGVTENEIVCSALFEGTVSAGPVDLVLDLFSLLPGNTLIEELLTPTGAEGKSLDCKITLARSAEDCPVGGEALLWVDELRLPAPGVAELTWESLIELMTAAPEFLLHLHHVAFELLCFLGGVTNLAALCEGLTSGKLENAGTGVLLEFSPEAPISSEELTCTNNLEPTVSIGADLRGDVVILHNGGGTLAVS